MKTYNGKILKISIIFAVLLCAALLPLLCTATSDVALAAGEQILEVKQVSELPYCGENYVKNESAKNAFLSVFSFTVNGKVISPDFEKITVISSVQAVNPGANYVCDIRYEDGETVYVAENVVFEIAKRKVRVIVYLNGQRSITVNENEAGSIKINYDYDGALPSDTRVETVNGTQVRTITGEALTNKAYVAVLPKTPVENATVTAQNARSPYYDFIYEKSYITVTRDTVPELTAVDDGRVTVSVSGIFSTVYSVDFTDIGTSATSKEYAEIKSDAERKYASYGTLLTDNEPVACYNVTILDADGETVYNTPATVRAYMDGSIKGRKSYSVIALYNNGNTDVLEASVSGDYLVFDAADMGDFIVLSPVEGINVTTYIVAIVAGVAIVLIVITLFALFRRKY